MRNQPVVGLLQLAGMIPYIVPVPVVIFAVWRRDFILIKNRDGICNETIPAKRKTVFLFWNHYRNNEVLCKEIAYGLHLLQGTYPAFIASSRVSK